MQVKAGNVAVCGTDQMVPVLGGGSRRFVGLDNSASTPPLEAVRAAVDQFAALYGSVHRGAGFKSQLASWALDEARQVVLTYLGADPSTHTAVFGKNTTEAINRLAQLYPFTDDDIVLVSRMEHHANDLPWRAHAQVAYIDLTPLGELDMDDLRRKLALYGARVRLVAVTGASNVTGFVNPYREIARLAHAHGAQFMLDAAQLAPHRAIAMTAPDPLESIDFLVLSGHKLYAPYGAGALIAPVEFLERVEPDQYGGGAVAVVTFDEVHLAAAPDRVEPGSPNTVGVLAMAVAMKQMMEAGLEHLDRHERELTTYALQRLGKVPRLRLYGSADPERTADRVGVIPFNLGELPHALVAAILAEEWGIGVRDGCFCAHPYVMHLMGVAGEAFERFRDRVLAGDRSEVPGLVRASLGLYNTHEDVDALVEALEHIARGEYREGYRLDTATGEYHHPEYRPDFTQFYPLAAVMSDR